MASLKLFIKSDIHNFELRSERNSSASCCVQITGVPTVNPFTRLKDFRVCRLSNESVEICEPNQHDLVVGSSSSSSSSNNGEGRRRSRSRSRKKGGDLWVKFRGMNKTIKGSTLFKYVDSNTDDGYVKEPFFVYDKDISDELQAAIIKISPNSSVDQCNNLLKHLEQCNEDKTLSFFEWMRTNGKLEGNKFAYNLALRVLGRKEDWVAAESLLQDLISNSPHLLSFRSFNSLIYACYRKGLSELGNKWFHLMLRNGVEPNVATFGMLMNLFQKNRNPTKAEFTFHKMRSFEIECTTAYSAMITIYTRLSLYDKAEEVIGFMKEDGVMPNLENWLVQINAYSQQGKLEEAERVLVSMEESGISPNIIAYNTLITGYGRISEMDAAQRLFQNLRNIGLQPDETTYRSMVEGWGRSNNYKEAKWYYDKLKQAGFKPNSSNLYTMINLQASYGDEDGTIRILDDMRKMGCQYSSMLSSLLQAYEKVRKVHKVPLVLRGSFYEYVLVDQTSCSILVMAYVKCHLVDDALDILKRKKWKDDIFEDNLNHLLICSCKESGHHDDAIKIFTQIPMSDVKPNLHIMCTMMDVYCIMGQFDEAKKLYGKLRSSETPLDMVLYNVIVRMFVKAKALKDACLVLDDIEKRKDIIPDIYLFRDMLRIYQQLGLKHKLEETYYTILKSPITWDQETYDCVINCCAHALPVDEISRLFDEMLQRGFLPNTITINVMLDVYGKAKIFKKARKVFWMARKWGLTDVISYNTIISAYGKNKDLRSMRSTVRRMEIHGFSVSLEAYNSMLDAYGKEQEIEKFRSVLKSLRESSCRPDHYTYNTLINIYGEQGWIEEVAGVLTELKECGLGPDLYSYNTLIKAYGVAGMVEKAVDVVKEMRQNGVEPNQRTYSNLIKALQKNDNYLEAVKWSLWMKQLAISNSE